MKRFFVLLTTFFFTLTTQASLPPMGRVRDMPGVRIATSDSTRCFPNKLVGFINEVRTRFGSVEIASGYRDPSDNRRRGGARRSQHTHCNAVDFRVPGVPKNEVRQFLAANFSGRAGIGYYCNDRFHLDVGTPRQWGGCQPSSRETATARARYPRTRTARASTPARGLSFWERLTGVSSYRTAEATTAR